MPTSSEIGSVNVERLWKRFRATERRNLLADHLTTLRHRLGNPGPARWNWALRDVEFHIEPGESVGLIGSNGAGKSTLLRILAGVMYPYAGSVRLTGRVGALIEVRAGLHGDLTGRENIFLYGSLLGLPRREVARRFDAIVEFAEIAAAIDRQVIFYSMGMQMRLGFSVAAFLEPDILLIDEVLAVGDAAFQQRCLDRVQDILRTGSTVVFVSHDLPAVAATCRRTVWMDSGIVREDGPTYDVLGRYRRAIEELADSNVAPPGAVFASAVRVCRPDGGNPVAWAPAAVSLQFTSPEVKTARVYLGISDGPATPAFVLSTAIRLTAGDTAARCDLPSLPLPGGHYSLWMSLVDEHGRDLIPWHPAAHFDVGGPRLDPAPPGVIRLAPVQPEASWSTEGRPHA